MGNGPDIGKCLQLGNSGFQGTILLFMVGQAFVQRNTFLDNTCQQSAPDIKFMSDFYVLGLASFILTYYLPEIAGLQVFISTFSVVFLEQ